MNETTKPKRVRFPRVLVADDPPSMRETVRALLEEQFEVVGDAEDGKQALAMAMRLEPDVAVLDVDMPGLDGFAVATQLRASGSETAIVFLSVHGGEDFAREGAACGGLAYVVKTDLYTRICDAVRLAAAGRPYPPKPTTHGA